MYGIQVAVTVSCCVLFIPYIALYSRYLNQNRDVLNDITQVNTTLGPQYSRTQTLQLDP